jgi:hypothetical protein
MVQTKPMVLLLIFLDLQFLEPHKVQYLDLHRELLKIDYLLQSEAALQNCKTLLVIETSLLMGCYVEWARPPPIEETQTGDDQLAVLSQSTAANDGDASADGGSGNVDCNSSSTEFQEGPRWRRRRQEAPNRQACQGKIKVCVLISVYYVCYAYYCII